MCYSAANMYQVTICNLKKALMLAWLLNDEVKEVWYYERLAIAYMNIGDIKRMN